MKRVGYLYEKIYGMDNLRLAHKNASKGKGWYEEVKEINKNPDKYLYKIQEMLINKTFKTSEYVKFTKNEKGKVREIYKLPYFPDRIVQWAILQVIEPYLVRHFTKNTYSAIPKRGIHQALKDVKKALYNKPEECKYCLKLDIRHYYQSINHTILKSKFRRLFKDNDLLWLLDEIIDSIDTGEVEDTGIPIGNYLSQYCGNFYLSDFDHFVLEQLSVSHYYRYMDDIVILDGSKERLHDLLDVIKLYLINELALALKPNYQIFPTYIRGLDFIGYRFFRRYTLLRKSTYKQLRAKMMKVAGKQGLINFSEFCRINSYLGWVKYCNGFKLFIKYIQPLFSQLNLYYNEVIKKGATNEKLWNNRKYSFA